METKIQSSKVGNNLAVPSLLPHGLDTKVLHVTPQHFAV